MIRVLVLYPKGANDKFDFDYYKNNHLKLVKELLNPVKIEIDKGISNPEIPTPYYAVTHMIFNSIEELATKYAEFGKELIDDKDQFTNIQIITQISDIIEV